MVETELDNAKEHNEMVEDETNSENESNQDQENNTQGHNAQGYNTRNDNNEGSVSTDQKTEETLNIDNIQNNKTTNEGKNFAKLREAKEKAERERDELFRTVQQIVAQEQVRNAQGHKGVTPGDDDVDVMLNPDDVPDWRDVKRYQDKKYKELKRDLQLQREQYINYTTEQRIKAQYADFDTIVNNENLRKLRESEPEIAKSIAQNTDLYSQASAAYKAIKNFGIYSPEIGTSESQRIKKNKNIPLSSSAAASKASESPLGDLGMYDGELTADMKKKIYQNALRHAKRR